MKYLPHNKDVKFEDFIFHSKLKDKLRVILDQPDKMPPALCFYGFAGNGKSSFAQYVAHQLSSSVCYYDVNEIKDRAQTFTKMISEIETMRTSMSLLHTMDKAFSRVIILDEFHNLSNSQKDAFKFHLENHPHSLFIIVLNVYQQQSLDKMLTPAILSRVIPISFNTPVSEIDELKRLLADKFPNLPEKVISTHLPDIRRITNLANSAFY